VLGEVFADANERPTSARVHDTYEKDIQAVGGSLGSQTRDVEQNDDDLRQVGKRRVPTLSMTVMIHPRCAHLLRGCRSLGALHAAQEHEFAVLPGVWVDLRAWVTRKNVASGWFV
jgi:hypothetical protein